MVLMPAVNKSSQKEITDDIRLTNMLLRDRSVMVILLSLFNSAMLIILITYVTLVQYNLTLVN